VVHKLPLVEALTGTTISLTTLDGRTLNISIPDVISPGYEKLSPKERMPISKVSGRGGNLRIKFDIKFPISSPQSRKQASRGCWEEQLAEREKKIILFLILLHSHEEVVVGVFIMLLINQTPGLS